MYKKPDAESNVVEKFRKVSKTVWVCLKAVITENTLKVEWMNKNNFYDNYNYYSDTIILHSQFLDFELT